MDLRKRSGVLALLLVALLGGGVAFAAWLTTGTGSVGGASGTTVDFTITATTPSTQLLYPGGSGVLTGTMSNPNPYAVSVTTVTLGAVTTSNPTACPAANVTVSTAPITLTTPVLLPAQTGGTPGTASLTLPNAIQMLVTAADGCKLRTFTVVASASGSAV